jgi:hypothetical protein
MPILIGAFVIVVWFDPIKIIFEIWAFGGQRNVDSRLIGLVAWVFRVFVTLTICAHALALI